MFDLLKKQDSGWVEYMWPKPGESLSTLKSSYVRKATLDGRPVIVGCGVYLADAPVAKPDVKKISAGELMARCATNPDRAFQASSSTDLSDAFRDIGRDITRLRISR